MTRIRRWAVRSAAVLIGAALLALAGILVVRWRAQREWEHYRAEALARGVKLAWCEFLPLEVPPAENYATGTIFERYRITSQSDGETVRPLRAPMPAKSNLKTQTASDRLARARAGMMEAGWLKEDTAPPEPARAVLLGLERLRPQLDELRAARSRAGCRFPQGESAPPKVEFHAGGIATDAGFVWSLRMDAHLAVAEPAEAREDFLDAMRLYVAMLGEPTLINGLIRQAILTNVLQAVNGGIAARQWRAEDLPEIAVALARVDVIADARHAYTSERGFINDACESMRGESIWKQAHHEELADLFSGWPRGWRLLLDLSSGGSWRGSGARKPAPRPASGKPLGGIPAHL